MQRYTDQRARGEFPSGLLSQNFSALAMADWVPAELPLEQLPPPTRPLLSEAEMSALGKRPTFLIELDKLPARRHVFAKLTSEEARKRWRHIKRQLRHKMPATLWNDIVDPHNIRERTGSTYGPQCFSLSCYERPEIGTPPPLASTHPLSAFDTPVNWPKRRWIGTIEDNYPDMTAIATFSDQLHPAALFRTLSNLPKSYYQTVPRTGDMPLIIQLHETRHIRHPEAVAARPHETHFQEFDSDHWALQAGIALGITENARLAWLADRAVNSFACHNRKEMDYFIAPALINGQLDEWPLNRTRKAYFELRYHTAAILTGQKLSLTAAEIHASVDRAYPMRGRGLPIQNEAISNAIKADTAVGSKIRSCGERRLLALKKLWLNKKAPLSAEAVFVAGLTLESAALFWRDLPLPKTRLQRVSTFNYKL